MLRLHANGTAVYTISKSGALAYNRLYGAVDDPDELGLQKKKRLSRRAYNGGGYTPPLERHRQLSPRPEIREEIYEEEELSGSTITLT